MTEKIGGLNVPDVCEIIFLRLNSYAKKLAAENATKEISGVKAIADTFDINRLNSF